MKKGLDVYTSVTAYIDGDAVDNRSQNSVKRDVYVS